MGDRGGTQTTRKAGRRGFCALCLESGAAGHRFRGRGLRPKGYLLVAAQFEAGEVRGALQQAERGPRQDARGVPELHRAPSARRPRARCPGRAGFARGRVSFAHVCPSSTDVWLTRRCISSKTSTELGLTRRRISSQSSTDVGLTRRRLSSSESSRRSTRGTRLAGGCLSTACISSASGEMIPEIRSSLGLPTPDTPLFSSKWGSPNISEQALRHVCFFCTNDFSCYVPKRKSTSH